MIENVDMELVKINGFDIIKSGPCTFALAEALAITSNMTGKGGFRNWVIPDSEVLSALAVLEPENIRVWVKQVEMGNPIRNFGAFGINLGNGDGFCELDESSCNHVRLVPENQRWDIIDKARQGRSKGDQINHAVKFNKEQREGFARACDTLAVTAVVGAIVGATGHSPLQTIEILGLIVASLLLFLIGFFFRR